jgi:hypothetical protein
MVVNGKRRIWKLWEMVHDWHFLVTEAFLPVFPAILDPRLAASPLLNNPSDSATPHRHFSAFPLTSHLHTPTLRLVSLHPLLSVTLSFLRVPEIHDGFSWKSFIARSTTVREVIDSVSDELGLTKALPVPGGGVLDYILEEVWRDGKAEGMLLVLYHNS